MQGSLQIRGEEKKGRKYFVYNPQLDTFIRVADAGSFNRAAEEAYITPTAVIKQINLLEDTLGVKLFERTHRGLILTKAGKSLYQDTKYIIQYCRDSVTRAKNAMQDNGSVIRIGSSPMTPAQLLMQLWPRIQVYCPDLKFQIVPFENTPENAREILANLGKNIDVVAGIFDETMLDLRRCAGLALSREPFCCAVSVHHRLAAKDKLKIEDLYGENLMLMRRDWSNYVDRLRDDIWQNHSQIHIVDFDFYSMEAFNRCENSNDVLLAIPGWATVHPLLKVIPVEWEHSIPFGLLHSPKPSETVRRFLEAARLAANHE
jgi:DNA-binding transcriptional LysR family regulator